MVIKGLSNVYEYIDFVNMGECEHLKIWPLSFIHQFPRHYMAGINASVHYNIVTSIIAVRRIQPVYMFCGPNSLWELSPLAKILACSILEQRKWFFTKLGRISLTKFILIAINIQYRGLNSEYTNVYVHITNLLILSIFYCWLREHVILPLNAVLEHYHSNSETRGKKPNIFGTLCR